MRLLLHSRRVATPAGLRDAVVEVVDGRIVAVDPAHPERARAKTLGDLVLGPGLVDSHVHVNEPGRTAWEGFTTATRAAAAGGITTIVDMPLNSIPVTTTAEALAVKLYHAIPKLHVDCAFWGGVVPGNAPEIAPMAAGGVVGCKAFLCHSGIDDFPASDVDTLRTAMTALAGLGRPLIAHAELEEPAEAHGPPHRYDSWLHARPCRFEDRAVALLIELCRETGCRTHIVHLSSAGAVPLLAAARAEGLPLTSETCPHYLCLTAEEVPDGRTEYKCAPPIREAANRDLLWEALAAGHIDFVVSDHSPCTPHLKLPERGDFHGAWGGIASLQLGLSTVWTEACRRGHEVCDVFGWMSTGPADFLGLPHKGRITVGADADLVAFDPDATWSLRSDHLHHRHATSPYVGRQLRGRIHHTWLAGREVARDGSPVGPPRGRPLLWSSE